MGQAEQIRQVAAAALVGSGVVVEDVAVHPAGKRRLVRVGVARDVTDLPADDLTSPVDPLTLDEVADASRVVSTAMDQAEPMGSAPYVLEVTSLGVDHPLTTPAQFRRNVGRLLALRLSGAPEDPTVREGRLVAAGPDGIRLADTPDDLLPYDRISVARVQVEFTHAGGKDD